MIEAILFDIDGVLINLRKKYFSQRLVDELGVQPELSSYFVTNFLMPAMVGKADVKVGLQQVINEAQLTMTVDELLAFWWNGEKEINQKVLDTVKKLQTLNKKLYLASDQERNRAEYLMTTLGLDLYFTDGYFSCDIGFTKTDKEFWHYILNALSPITPQEMIFIDDDSKKVQIAQEFGLNAIVFIHSELLNLDLKNVISF